MEAVEALVALFVGLAAILLLQECKDSKSWMVDGLCAVVLGLAISVACII